MRSFAKMANLWGVPIEEAREFAKQHNIQSANRMYKIQDSKMIRKVTTGSGTLTYRIERLKKFNLKASNEKFVHASVIAILERSGFGDLLKRISDPDLIVKVRCSKTKTERML